MLHLINPTSFKGALSLAGAILMYFTPDDVDRIIMAVLGGMGITDFIAVSRKDKGSDA